MASPEELLLRAARRRMRVGNALSQAVDWFWMALRVVMFVCGIYVFFRTIGEVHAIHQLLFEQRCR